TYQTRVEFLKQSTFVELSQEALKVLSLHGGDDAGGGIVALVPEQTDGVMKFNRAVVLPGG
ncbi:MAG: hypothetical protein D3909_03055, partial [Candidatus Electrothrix sp. ATG1]|nr:hypothetical protein [Candidatus Electrothrix sp. ATG1]